MLLNLDYLPVTTKRICYSNWGRKWARKNRIKSTSGTVNLLLFALFIYVDKYITMLLREIFNNPSTGYPITNTKHWNLNTTEYQAHTQDGRVISVGIGYDDKNTTKRNHGFDAMTVSFAVDDEVAMTGGGDAVKILNTVYNVCLLYTSPSPRDGLLSRMPSSA